MGKDTAGRSDMLLWRLAAGLQVWHLPLQGGPGGNSRDIVEQRGRASVLLRPLPNSSMKEVQEESVLQQTCPSSLAKVARYFWKLQSF